MEKINIICVDDQQEVLDSVMRDLRPLTSHVRLEEASGAADCLKLLEEIDGEGDRVALIISDQVMPGESGVDLLRKVSSDRRFAITRKALLTGQATHSDTINAINDSHIDNYIEKPWQPEKLLAAVKRLLTLYILDAGLDYAPFMPVLDQPTLLSRLH
ncbi:MAG: response regulator [Akkermansia sp.]|nr:response regulator [Akkermansia sp.]MCD8071084.1 response regulator [Akkermansiaceae bacterium]